ncbi:uncharacterized protein LOC143583993, partial [Bidens hawaiensis]|uniref:uncharacterized protein LOC143583993 n=1 Tax=Bidens hawaiensis TaxID=980011 RepID=UPI004049FF01
MIKLWEVVQPNKGVIAQYKNAREIWTALKSRYAGAERVQKARLLKLKSEFEKLKMAENETVDEFVLMNLKNSRYGFKGNEFRSLDAVLDKYFQLVASIEQIVDLDSLMFEDAIGRLKVFEERLQGRERASNSHGQLLFNRAESNYKGKSYDQSGSQGKGWPSSQGRGKSHETGGQDRDDEDQDGCDNRDGQHRGSRYTGQRRTKGHQLRRKVLSQVQFYRCDEFSHFTSTCPERMNKKEESNLNKIDDFDPRLFMIKDDQKTIFRNKDGVIPKHFETEPMEKDV